MTRCANAAFTSAGLSLRFLIVGLAILALTGCDARIESHGHSIDQVELNDIQPGESTRIDVFSVLGQPSFEGAFGSGKIYYVSQIMIEPAGGKKTTQSRTVIAFSFDENDIVSAIDITDETTGNLVAHIDAKTPTPGDRFGVVDQIFSNLKRRRIEE